MKGLKKIALVTAIAAAPFAANAELTAMDDSAMSAATGQAGLTIDLSANVKIGEVAYQDEGFIAISGIEFGGAGIVGAAGPGVTNNLDNVSIDIDVAGAAPGSFKFGMESQILTTLKDAGVVTDTATAFTSADLDALSARIGRGAVTDAQGGLLLDAEAAKQQALIAGYKAQGAETTTLDQLVYDSSTGTTGIEDGDLVIHLGTTDAWFETDGTGSGIVEGADFGLKIGKIALQQSTYAVGDLNATANTVLLSNLNLGGKIGPVDIIIDESTSAMSVNAYFAVRGGVKDSGSSFGLVGAAAAGASAQNALKVDFLNVEVGKFQIANVRGANAGSSMGYAHAAARISNKLADGSAAKGLFIEVLDFSADIDVEDIYIGGSSIGSLYITDLEVTATMDVYGH
jgi:uncharacterized protein DUF6160